MKSELTKEEVFELQCAASDLHDALGKAAEIIQELKGWAITHSMQTYSKLASESATRAEAFLKEHGLTGSEPAEKK